jgi:NADPH:quinone reductase-like Zn-dependent oxidoreductase
VEIHDITEFGARSMKAAQINEYGHSDVVRVQEVDTPLPGAGQVQVEVHASSINPVDTAVREGYLAQMVPLALPATLGIDVAGVVTALGEGVTGFSIGDRVFGSASVLSGGSGAFATVATVPVGNLAKMPDNIGFTEAGSIVLTGASAVQALTEHLQLQPGQKLLVLGGAGGVGTLAVQVAKHLGAYVAATATGDCFEVVKALGANEVIDYKHEAFDEKLSDYDAVLDTVGGDTGARAYRVLKRGGTIVLMLAQPDADLMAKYGVTAIAQQTRANTENLNALAQLVQSGAVRPNIDRAYSLDRIAEAFEAKERGGVRGKIGIRVRDAV